MQTRIARWGNGLALHIPQPIADRLGFGDGGVVELLVDDGHLVVPSYPAEARLDQLLTAITPENLPEGFDDRPVGHEAL